MTLIVQRNRQAVRLLILRILVRIVPFLLITFYAIQTVHADFGYFYYAFQAIWHHSPGNWLYDMNRENAWLQAHHQPVYNFTQYIYPPQFAVILSWFALFPFHTAEILWSLLSIVGFLAGSWWIQGLANLRDTRMKRVLFYLTVLLNFPFWWDFFIGNANWLIFVLMSGSLYLRYKHGRTIWPGVFLGLAATFKLTPVFFLLYLLFRKEWKWIASTCITMLLSSLLSIAVVGIHPFLFYATHFTQFVDTSMHIGTAPYNSSLIGVLSLVSAEGLQHLNQQTIHLIFVAFVIAAGMVLMVLFSRMKDRPLSPLQELPLALLPILLFSPLLEGPHLLIGFIAVWLLLGRWWDVGNQTVGQFQKTVVGTAFGFIVLVWSPAGWFLSHFMPTEYFWTVMLTFVLAIWANYRGKT